MLTCCAPSVLTSCFKPANALSPTPVCTATAFKLKYAAATTAVILMKNCTISITSTPHKPECAAKTTFSTPQIMIVCHGGIPKRMFAILQPASVTMPMMKQLKNSPR